MSRGTGNWRDKVETDREYYRSIKISKMWNRGTRAAKQVKYEKGNHRHDELPGMCGPIDGKFTHMFTAQNAFNVDKPTTLQETWIQMKRNYPNSVVLVRIGKFYEVFHRDADIIVDVADQGCYMCGKIAWSGFPENVLEKFTNRVKEAGYHVIKTI